MKIFILVLQLNVINKHNESFETTVRNYKRCSNGLPCCGHEAQKTKTLNYKRDNTGRYKKFIFVYATPIRDVA